jgi:hypothetical protein
MEYEIGYKSPPRAWCFKKGASGNPFGRPKKAVDPRETAEQRAWDQTMQIDVGGRARTITLREFRVRSLIPRCLSGDLDAIAALYKLPEIDTGPKLTLKSVIIKQVH